MNNDEFKIVCTPDVAPNFDCDVCFKAYAFVEYPEWFVITDLYWDHPQRVNINEFEDFMKEIFEIARDEAKDNWIIYHWITVVAYDLNGDAMVACDYQRRHPTSADYWYGDEINHHIAKL